MNHKNAYRCYVWVRPRHEPTALGPAFWCSESSAILVFLNGPILASFSLFSSFHYSWQLTMNIIFCWWVDSNRGPLESEATALPTDPQPLPPVYLFVFKFLFDVSFLPIKSVKCFNACLSKTKTCRISWSRWCGSKKVNSSLVKQSSIIDRQQIAELNFFPKSSSQNSKLYQPSLVGCQFSTVGCQLSTVGCQLSTVDY